MEVAVVRQFSALQVVYGLAGLGLIVSGNRRMLAEAAGVVTALPLLLTAPLYRRWHLRWGATPAEARAAMPGDELVPVSHFTATRAITIEARPCDVWPWLTQVGYGRAGFYSYDLLDNLGRPSATAIMPQWQRAARRRHRRADGQPSDAEHVIPCRGRRTGRMPGLGQAGLDLGMDACTHSRRTAPAW